VNRLAEGLAKPRAQKTLAAIQQRVGGLKEKSRGIENGAVALALDGVRLRRGQQLARLMIAERRCHAFATVRFRPFDAFHRVVRDGVLLAQILNSKASDASRCRIADFIKNACRPYLRRTEPTRRQWREWKEVSGAACYHNASLTALRRGLVG
jgi:hypothetical protein